MTEIPEHLLKRAQEAKAKAAAKKGGGAPSGEAGAPAGEATPAPMPNTNIGAMIISTLRWPARLPPSRTNEASTLKRLAHTASRSIGRIGIKRVAATLPSQTPGSRRSSLRRPRIILHTIVPQGRLIEHVSASCLMRFGLARRLRITAGRAR